MNRIGIVVFTENTKSLLIQTCFNYLANKTTILFDLYLVETKDKEIFECREQFFKDCENEFICVVPEYYLVDNNWLEDLLNNYTKNENAGVISIKNGSEDCFISSVISDSDIADEKELRNVFKTKHNWVEGLLFFEKKKFDNLKNSYNEMFVKNMHDVALSMRFSLDGFQNYYIPKQIAICLKENENKFSSIELNEFKTKINNLLKQQENGTM